MLALADALVFVLSQAGTAAPWSSRAPVLLPSPAAVSAGEASFKLTFSMDQPGTLNYLVLYKSLFARFLDTYVVFDNQVSALQLCEFAVHMGVTCWQCEGIMACDLCSVFMLAEPESEPLVRCCTTAWYRVAKVAHFIIVTIL